MSLTIQANNATSQSEVSIDVLDQWFSNMIDHLRFDHFMLQTDSATKEKKEFYSAFLLNDTNKIFSSMRSNSSQFFISSLVVDYLNELKAAGKNPLKLALGISDSKILVWSEIEDNDEEMEDLLLITEAKVNGKYHQKGFYINSTIIEKSDNLHIPPHYQTII
jgi:hypothetical protein